MPVRTKLVSFILFAIAVGALILGLRVMSFVPAAVQGGVLQQYRSIDEVREKLKIRDVYVPSYYPQCFLWPPSLVAAQTKPFTAIMIGFTRRDGDDSCLVITQTQLPHMLKDEKTAMERVKEKVRYSLKGRDALLEVGACKDDVPCSRITWNEKEYRITVLMKSTPIDLVKIAESMMY